MDLITWPTEPDKDLDHTIEVAVEALRQDYLKQDGEAMIDVPDKDVFVRDVQMFVEQAYAMPVLPVWTENGFEPDVDLRRDVLAWLKKQVRRKKPGSIVDCCQYVWSKFAEREPELSKMGRNERLDAFQMRYMTLAGQTRATSTAPGIQPLKEDTEESKV